MGAQLEHFAEHLERRRVAAIAHHSLVLVLHLGPTLRQLAQQHGDTLENVDRFEPCGHERQAVLTRHELVRAGADHGAHVAGAEEPVELHAGRIEDRFHRRNDGHVVAEDREVLHVAFPRLHDGDGRGGSRGLEPDGEEHHVAVGFVLGDGERIEWGVDDPNVGALGLGFEQRARTPGHTHEVAEATQGHAVLLGDRNGIVDAAHGNHTHGATGSVHHLDALRQQRLDAVAIDGVGVAAARLHELASRLICGELLDLGDEDLGRLRVSEFADELHA